MPRSKSEKKSVSNEEIAAAALDFIDREGIDALSFRKLSDVTGVPTMTIVNRFGSKDALLKAALGTMLAENVVEPIEGESWQDSLRRVAHMNRDMALRHPKAFMLFVLVPMFESPVLEYTQRVFATHANQNLPAEMPQQFLSLMHSFLSGFQLGETYTHQEKESLQEEASQELADAFDLFTEEAFSRNLEILIAGLQVTYNLP